MAHPIDSMLLEHQRDLFVELFAEGSQDLAFVKAIEEGEATESVSRKTIFELLEAVHLP